MAPSAALLRAAAMAFVGIVASGRELDKCAACHVAMTSLERVLALEHLDEAGDPRGDCSNAAAPPRRRRCRDDR